MKKWSLNAKIYFVLSVFVLGSIAIAFIGLSKMDEIKSSLNLIVNGSVARLSNAQELKSLFLIQALNEKNLILEESQDGMRGYAERLKQRHAQISKLFKTAFNLSSEDGKKDLTKFYSSYEKWWTNTLAVQEHAMAARNNDAFSLSKTTGAKLRVEVENTLEEIVTRNFSFMKAEEKRADNDFIAARNTVTTISFFVILSGLVMAFFILRFLGKAIDQVIANLTDNSNQVTSAAQQIASSSEELSQAATEQAASLEQTAASIEEMNSMVQKNAENAKRTSELAISSNQSAERGKTVVQDMIKAIDDISISNNTIMEQVDHSNQKISDIVKVIAEIGEKTKVINDIVFQTKLLSFNASVEAARAGEHGQGFAVVAEEVGNLAEMSGNAAKEISSMLDESIKKVEGIVHETKTNVGSIVQDGKLKVEVGSKVARQCGSVLDEIVGNVVSVTEMANEISTACQEQAQGVQEITKAMSQLDQVTQTNAATSEEAASAAEELSAQSDSLRAVVEVLVKTIRGDKEQKTQSESTGTNETKIKHLDFNETKSNVVSMKPNKKNFSEPVFKKAVGFEVTSVPSENDPRFEDV